VKQIFDLNDLYAAAHDRRAVVVPSHICFSKPRPAEFTINMAGSVLLRLFDAGMFVYEKEVRVKTSQKERIAESIAGIVRLKQWECAVVAADEAMKPTTEA
jgi:hypothetical protein